MIWLAICISALNPLRLEPRDDAYLDQQFMTFRDSLIAAIKKGNVEWVNARIDSNIVWSYHGRGKNAMFKLWREKPEGLDGFYKELLKVVTRGGRWETFDRKKVFLAPYYVFLWPDSLDCYETDFQVALEMQTPIYNGINGRRIGYLSYEIVEVLDTRGSRGEWLRLSTSKGIVWGRDEDFGSPMGYRANFEKVKGSYMLTLFSGPGCSPEVLASNVAGAFGMRFVGW
ncbi:MAG: hypothetical protein KIT74_03030 [Fimbriimonadales bacterium]|nr:hypothetical protein [Fimbriimonadales bacterium]